MQGREPTHKWRSKYCLHTATGTLSEDDDDGSETFGKKMNLRFFKLEIQATFPGVEFLKDFIQVQKEEGKFVVVCPRPL